MNFSKKIIYLSSVLLLAFIMACSTNNDNGNARYFEFTHQSDDVNYTIVAKTTNEEVIAKAEQELSLPFEERTLHINGPIERENRGITATGVGILLKTSGTWLKSLPKFVTDGQVLLKKSWTIG